MKKKTAVLHLITALGIGGAEKVVFDLASQMDQKQFMPHVIALGEADALLPQFTAAGISTQVLYMPKTIKGLAQALQKVRRYIDAQDIQLIHAHLFHAMFFAGLLKLRGMPRPIIFTSHSVNMESRLREYCLRWLRPLRACDVVFSKNMNLFFRKNRYEVIPNGILSRDYDLGLTKFSVFTFLGVGRFSHEKNFKALIEIVRAIPARYHFQILLAGTGEEWESLQNLIRKHQLNDRIRLLGMRKDIPELCNRAHAFLLPSLWEGLPIVLLEAGAAALPVIATPVGAIPEVLDATSGYLTELSDFASQMCTVMENYESALEKGEQLKTKIKKTFDLSTMVHRHARLYTTILNEQLT
ncbi:MAG: glycosyltransferase [Bacteroidota bacterium]